IPSNQNELLREINSNIYNYKKEKNEKFNKQIEQKVLALKRLTSQDKFIKKSDLEHLFQDIITPIQQVRDSFWEMQSNKDDIQNFNFLKLSLSNLDNVYKKHNENFIGEEILRNKELFDKVEKNPLVYSQRRSCVVNEENNLILAGAGSGKTSVMIARCAYLINTQNINANEILLLAFNKTAAKELEERAQKYLPGLSIQAETFHSLGLKIINQSLEHSIKITPLANDEDAFKKYISNCITQILKNNSSLMQEALQSLAPEKLETKSEFEFKTEEEYLEFIKKNQYRTLKGELVKSQGELQIANHLFSKGISYIYEAPYQTKTSNFEKAQYFPDFYLEEHDVYIEFYGIDKNGNTASFINKEEYLKTIEWKRATHKQNSTKLIELYHYDLESDKLIQNLDEALSNLDIKDNLTYTSLYFDVINDFFENLSISEKIMNVINLTKTINIDQIIAQKRLEEFESSKSEKFIVKLSFEVFKQYKYQLQSQNEIDFSDMIIKATELIKNETYIPKWKHILVDEFQDISLTRAELIKSLKNKGPGTSLFCVGDDWQAIYHFAGSKSELVRNFKEFFGNFWQETIDTTFRFNDQISMVASKFVMENPLQIKKDIKTVKFTKLPKINIALKNRYNSEFKIVESFLRKLPTNNDKKPTVLFLHKDNLPLSLFTDRFNENLRNKFSNFEYKFLTYHKSKGLEADYVIALNMKSGENGFPADRNFISIEEKINPISDTYPYAEERRIFYVILTRAKDEVLLVSDMQAPSVFISELINNKYNINLDGAADHCPECLSGFLVEKSTNDGVRKFLGCSNYKDLGCKYTERLE
ncbi:MAG: UvrD-helicase domain-containing protein, partial [Bacteriovoracaceae bacterium]|nr:UvrD-helicase domain-containing protein [Bacteriovoracaceae bacterium]